MRINILSLIILVTIVTSCKKGKEMHTKSGMKYILHRESNGKKPEVGDWVIVTMVYKNENDSVLYDSRTGGKPLRFELRKPPFTGSLEEGLAYISKGDSATFIISADSMFEKVFAKNVDPSQLKNRPKKGSFMKFDISLLDIQSAQQAEMDMVMNESRQERAEQDALDKYLKEKNITAEKQPKGYYVIITSAGKGEEIKLGSTVQINYTGRFLNGTLFDSNSSSGKPYTFHVGGKEVISGWDFAFQQLHYGDKATLIIPSKLGYGSEGLKRPNSKDYVVPPYSTLVFDVEVLMSESSAKK